MRVAFVGKGGSGKTTLSSLFSRYLSSKDAAVVAIDADINQHLGVMLGLSEAESALLPPMGLEIDRIKDYLRGTNPRIASSASMIKTTPPGRGSRLMSVREDNPIYAYFAREVADMKLLATGPFNEDDIGLHCYHSKVGAVELLLNHFLDGEGEYIVVDMTAGADSFASGLFTKFDLTFLVVEPTRKSLSVYKQYKTYIADYDVKLKVIGNKIETEDDLTFLHEYVGNDLLTWIRHSNYIRAIEKGQHQPLSHLEAVNTDALAIMKRAVDECSKDWEKLYQQTVAFHRKNAVAWANAVADEDLTRQIDPDYSLLAEVKHSLSSVS